MYVAHPFLRQPADDAKLWRYVTPTVFLAMLLRRSLHFAPLDSFEDPFEGVPPRAVLDAARARHQPTAEDAPPVLARWREMIERCRATVCASCYTYALTALTSVFRLNGHALDVRGTGTLCRDGADCNLFSFLFTTQDADGALRTTFSLSQSGFSGKVPEPGALTLLGLGLAGLAFGVRRRLPR